jgi:alkanesulfonate monooxygenase SsuD/methylene tetrahydromethanopterin reductase-like flavin-dependent oxidoreductase (luciferase family)
MAHTLDEISDGRLIVGIGAGWHQPEFDAFGFPYDNRVDRLEEALQILSPLLKGESVDFKGTYYHVENCFIKPLGPRELGAPLLIGALGPRMLRLTAQYADQWNIAWLGDHQDIVEPLRRLRKACIEANRDPYTLEVTASVSIAFPELGKANPFSENPLTGPVEAVAEAFQRYAESGINHLILQPTPQGLPTLNRVVDAVNLYRRTA